MEWLTQAAGQLVLSFVPLFVAMDAIGNLPFLLFLTAEVTPQRRIRMIRSAIFTALGLGVGFLVLGKAIFLLLGIKVDDFLVAGGLVLLALSVKDLATGKLFEASAAGGETAGVVPLGTPLVVGPAVLTTLLLLIDQYFSLVVVLAFMLNLAFAWLVFAQADHIARFLGKGGLAATAKIAGLLLAAIAVKMIRQGILGS